MNEACQIPEITDLQRLYRWQEEAIDAWERAKRHGIIEAMTNRRIVREYERDPLALGFISTQWTVPLLARQEHPPLFPHGDWVVAGIAAAMA